MFSLFYAKAKIAAVTVLSEMRGRDRVAACCVTFEMSSNNYIISEFDSQLRFALYSRDPDRLKQMNLDGVEDDMDGLTTLKFPRLGMPIKFEWDGAGYEMHLHIGASGHGDIVLQDVDLGSFTFDCKDGGTVITKFKATMHPNAVEQGKIDHMLQLETELSLKPPSEKQKSLAA
jgi:hypothetical protein